MTQETQMDAFRSIKNKEQKQNLVLKAISSYGGLTLFELVKILEWPVNRISGRVSELNRLKKIYDTGLRRLNPESQKNGIVWGVYEI